MLSNIQQKITENIKSLDSFQLLELLDFTEFLCYKRKNRMPDNDKIDSLCGKYSNSLSDSRQFALKKREEIKAEEEKWQRI